MKNAIRRQKVKKVWALLACMMMVFFLLGTSQKVYASQQEVQISEEAAQANATSAKAMAAGIAIGLAAAAGAIGMGIAIARSSESISRQPEAAGDIRSSLVLGLVFLETAIIYALIIAILIIFVL